MNLKFAFVLLALFLVPIPVNANTCCDPTGACSCTAPGSCSYNCDSGWYDCDQNSANGCESNSPCAQYAFHLFTFNLSSYEISDIVNLTYCFNGYHSGTSPKNATLQYYNVTSTSWVYDQDIGTPQSTKCKTFTNVNDVINSTSKIFQFAARANVSQGGSVTIYTDYVYLDVGVGGVGGWDYLTNLTSDVSATYVSTKWNYAGNCTELVYRSGTVSPYSVEYASIGTCTSPSVVVVGFTITVPGQNPIYAAEGGNATADIEFNLTSGHTASNVIPCLAGTSTCQTDAIPIFKFNNTGTTTLNWYIYLDSSLPSSITLKGDSDNTPAGATTITTSGWLVASSIAPTGSQDAWLWTDFNAAGVSDATSRNLESNATSS